MRVIVTRPQSEGMRWVEDLRQRGFDAVALPLIAIAPAPDPEALHVAWQRLPACQAVMFVSGNAVRHFFQHKPSGAQWPAGTRAWSPGRGTRDALLAAGLDEAMVDTPPADAAQFDSETLWHGLARRPAAGERVLVVRGADHAGIGAGRDWLAVQLASAGVRVDFVVAYRRMPPEWTGSQRAQALRGARDGAWLFSSSQAIANLQALLAQQAWSDARAVATHPRIAQAAREAGFGVVCESRPTLDAVAAALESIR